MIALWLSLSSLLLQAHASCLHGTSHMPRRATASGGVAVSTYGYTGEIGPLNWAGLAPEYELCATGKTQTPINIDANISTSTITPKIDIAAIESAEFENLGSTVLVAMNGTTTLGNATFNLRQFHFHTPSEHRIEEEYFPLEMHLVHEAADNSGHLAVLTLLFEVSSTTTTPLLTTLGTSISAITHPGTVTTTGPLDMAPLIAALQTSALFQYTGSLTTPPCSEGVGFFIAEDVLPVDVETFRAFKRVIRFNSRYTQNTLGRDNLIVIAAADLEAAAGAGGAESNDETAAAAAAGISAIVDASLEV